MKYIVPGILFIVLIFIANVFPYYTGDSGDSIMHYLFAKYAYKHPQNFLHHWAKPLFVFIAAPFCQFGFKGMVYLNILLAVSTSIVTCKIAELKKIKNPWLSHIFLFFSPIYFALIFSGLTEYLFAFILICSIYLFLKEKHIISLVLISFLPFIRSEGLFIIPIFIVALIIIKKIKYSIWLSIGHLVYGIIGVFSGKSFFWTFTEIPYVSLHSKYGQGQWLDFVHRLMYCTERPLILLFGLGMIVLTFNTLKSLKKHIHSCVYYILVPFTFLVFFMAHTSFWALGIFDSMGLARVMICVLPLLSLIALEPLQFLYKKIKKNAWVYFIQATIVFLVIIYPFTYRRQGIVWNKKMFENSDNLIVERELKPFIQKNYPHFTDYTIASAHPYVALSFNLDIFDTLKHVNIYSIHKLKERKNGLVFWDHWSAKFEGAPPFAELENLDYLQKKFEYPTKESDDKLFAVYEKK